jgi:pyruvate/2-oxoglutarate/acetoin dehydrogenase E1 component
LKSDYIPCISWGRNARFSSTLNVGDNIRLWGRVQCRNYQKKLENGEAVKALLIEYEITVDIIVSSLISPVPIKDIISFIGECEIIATLEEGTVTHGWGSEKISQIANDRGRQNNRRFIKFASADCPIPSNHLLENELLPSAQDIITNIRRLKNGKLE